MDSIVRLGAGTGLNRFEISDSSHAAGLPIMFDRGHLDHPGLDVADAAAFWMLRDRLIAGALVCVRRSGQNRSISRTQTRMQNCRSAQVCRRPKRLRRSAAPYSRR